MVKKLDFLKGLLLSSYYADSMRRNCLRWGWSPCTVELSGTGRGQATQEEKSSRGSEKYKAREQGLETRVWRDRGRRTLLARDKTKSHNCFVLCSGAGGRLLFTRGTEVAVATTHLGPGIQMCCIQKP